MSQAAASFHPSMITFTSIDDRRDLTLLIMRIFDKWSLTSKQQLNLLGLAEESRYMLQRYRRLESLLPYEKDKIDRVCLLLAIYENLHALYPENQKLRDRWLTSNNHLLSDKQPIEMMMKQGMIGIAKVARYLDFQMVQ